MPSRLRLIGLFGLALSLSAQHPRAAAFRGTAIRGFSHGVQHPFPRFSRFPQNFWGPGSWFDGSVFGPGYPLLEDDTNDSFTDAYSPEMRGILMPPAFPPSGRSSSLQAAHPIVKEYNWNSDGSSATGSGDFTIALRDGSFRKAVAAWVQNGKLFYVDAEGKQQVLLPDVINRNATLQLNNQKNLRFQLPPG